MPEYSDHQKKIIKRYYNNRDQLDEQRLSELVTELFLAKGPKRKKLWESTETVLLRLNVPPDIVQHAIKSGDPVVVAELLKDVQAGSFKSPGGRQAT